MATLKLVLYQYQKQKQCDSGSARCASLDHEHSRRINPYGRSPISIPSPAARATLVLQNTCRESLSPLRFFPYLDWRKPLAAVRITVFFFYRRTASTCRVCFFLMSCKPASARDHIKKQGGNRKRKSRLSNPYSQRSH